MGFDVYGLKPNNEPKPDTPDWALEDDKTIKAYFTWQENTPGAYFRMNVWGWHPLWDFVHNHCQDIFDKHIGDFDEVETLDQMYSTCHHNDGFIVPANIARKIAQRLYHLDNIGVMDEAEVSQDIEIERMTMDNCNICDGTGTRKGWEGWQSEDEWLKTHPSLVTENKAKEELYKILDEASKEGIKGLGTGEITFKWANEMKGCNMCKGVGKVKPFEASYKIEANYIREFAKFCDKSGGFQIW
jgi:hypothetical protein